MKHKLIIATFLGVSGGVIFGLVLKYCTPQPWSQRKIMYIKFPGEIFMSLTNSIILPLVVSSVVSATCNLSKSGPIGLMALCYYSVTTSIGIILSVILTQSIRPGKLLNNENLTSDLASKHFMTIDTLLDLLRNLISDNLIKACFMQYQTVLKEPENTTKVPINEWAITHQDIPGTDVIGLVFFSLLLGLAAGKLGEKNRPLLNVIDSFSQVMMNIMNWIIMIAPIGTFFLIPGRILEMTDFSLIFKQLGAYILTVFIGLILQGFLILPILYFLLTRRSPYKIIMKLGPAFATAFGTSSSTATVPVTIKCLQELGIDPKVLRFVVPIGATINMDGIALYETVGAIFIIQMRGLNFSLFKIIAISITCTISCIGAAGLPSGGYMMLIMVLNSIGVPVDDIALIIAIDCFVDRFRTTINIISDAFASGIISYLLTNKCKQYRNTMSAKTQSLTYVVK
ncbi:excitatory amino acid transporter 3-like [Vespa velutina]|uniref:excitatory amino acid transporter 3-like n=1 Tax=Vespa velutina TaxID=202808 RepID=UPI001FB3E0FD|nr:excitatory amino acid transporter 3-like [Vespa velutina]XP_047347424.1 excitatory amino acid transporter 3-like [Vespa velutina]